MPPHDEHRGGVYALVATATTLATLSVQQGCAYFQRRRAATNGSEWKLDAPLQPDVGIQDTFNGTPFLSPAEYDGGYGVDVVNDTLNVSGATEYGSPLVESPLAFTASEMTISMNSAATPAFTLLERPNHLLVLLALLIVIAVGLMWCYREAITRMQLAVDDLATRLKLRFTSLLPGPVRRFLHSFSCWYSCWLLYAFYLTLSVFPASEKVTYIHIGLAALLALLWPMERLRISVPKIITIHEDGSRKNIPWKDRTRKGRTRKNRAFINAHRNMTSDRAAKEHQHAAAIKDQHESHDAATWKLVQTHRLAMKQLADDHQLDIEELRDRRKAAEVEWSTRHETTQTALQTSRAQNFHLQRIIKQLEPGVRSAEEGKRQMRDKYLAESKRMRNEKEGVDRVMKQNGQLIKQNGQLRRHINRLRRSQNAKLQRQASRLLNLHASRRRMLEQFDVQQQHVAKLQDDLKSAQDCASTHGEQLETLQTNAKQVYDQLNNAKTTIAQQEHTIDELQDTKSELEAQSTSLSATLNAAESAKAAFHQEKYAAVGEKENLMKAKNDAEASERKAEDALNKLRQDLSIVEDKLKAAQTANGNLEKDKANMESVNKRDGSALQKQKEAAEGERDQAKAMNEELTKEIEQLKQKLLALEIRATSSSGTQTSSTTLMPQYIVPVVSVPTKLSGDAAPNPLDAPSATSTPQPEKGSNETAPQVPQQGEAGPSKPDLAGLKKLDGGDASLPLTDRPFEKVESSPRAKPQPAGQPRTKPTSRPRPSIFQPKPKGRGSKPLAGSSTTGVNRSSGIALPPPEAIIPKGVAKDANDAKSDCAAGVKPTSGSKKEASQSPNVSGASILAGSDGSRRDGSPKGGNNIDKDAGSNGDSPAKSRISPRSVDQALRQQPGADERDAMDTDESGLAKPSVDEAPTNRSGGDADSAMNTDKSGQAKIDNEQAPVNSSALEDINVMDTEESGRGKSRDHEASANQPDGNDNDTMDTDENPPSHDPPSASQPQNSNVSSAGSYDSIIPFGLTENRPSHPSNWAPFATLKGPSTPQNDSKFNAGGGSSKISLGSSRSRRRNANPFKIDEPTLPVLKAGFKFGPTGSNDTTPSAPHSDGPISGAKDVTVSSPPQPKPGFFNRLLFGFISPLSNGNGNDFVQPSQAPPNGPSFSKEQMRNGTSDADNLTSAAGDDSDVSDDMYVDSSIEQPLSSSGPIPHDTGHGANGIGEPFPRPDPSTVEPIVPVPNALPNAPQASPGTSTVCPVNPPDARLAEAESQISDLHHEVTAIGNRLSMLDTQIKRTPDPKDLLKIKENIEKRKDWCLEQIKAKQGDVEHLKNEIRDARLTHPKRDETGLSLHHSPHDDGDSAPQLLPQLTEIDEGELMRLLNACDDLDDHLNTDDDAISESAPQSPEIDWDGILREVDVGDSDEDNLDVNDDDAPQSAPQPPNPADDELEGLCKQREELEEDLNDLDKAVKELYKDWKKYQNKGDTRNAELVGTLIKRKTKLKKEDLAELKRIEHKIGVLLRPIAKPRSRRRQPAPTLNGNISATTAPPATVVPPATAAPAAPPAPKTAPHPVAAPQPGALPETDDQKLKRLRKELENLEKTSRAFEKGAQDSKGWEATCKLIGDIEGAKKASDETAKQNDQQQSVEGKIWKVKQEIRALNVAVEPSSAAPQTASAPQTAPTLQATLGPLQSVNKLLEQHGEKDSERLKRLQAEVERRDAYIKPRQTLIASELEQVRELERTGQRDAASTLRKEVNQRQTTVDLFDDDTAKLQEEIDQLEEMHC